MGEITTKESRKVAEYSSDTDSKIYDLYSSLLNYKKGIEEIQRIEISLSWTPADSRRREKAYELLNSYFSNFSRDFRNAPETGDTSLNDNLSEAGDPFWYCEKMRDKLLGGEISIGYPIPNNIGNENVLRTLIEADHTEPGLKKKAEERLTDLLKFKDIANAREAHLQGWFKDLMIFNIIHLNELKCSSLGDCVYFVYWNEEKNIPIVKTYDPGFVFPYFYNENPDVTIEEGKDDLVIERWYLGWNTFFNDEQVIYRETYELRKGTINGLASNRCFRHAAYYAYNKDSAIELNEFKTENIYDYDNPERNGLVVEWEDLGIDFIPFQWVPNISIEGVEPFGLSNIQMYIDIFDNMINNYTDTNTNSEYLGGAVVAASGKEVEPVKNSDGSLKAIKIQPNSVYFLGEGGQLSIVDTSKMQEALLKTEEVLYKKLLNNTNIPDILTGRGDSAGGQLSGFALLIRMQPFVDKMVPMRASRQEHYGDLLLKIQKLYQIHGDDYEKQIFADNLYKPEIKFGDLSPADENDTVKRLNLLNVLLSDETVLEIAKKEGYEINVQEELERKNAQKDAETARNRTLFGERLNDETPPEDEEDNN